MALGTLTVQVNALTNNAYASFSNTLIQAYYYCSVKLGGDISLSSGTVGTDAVATNDNEGMAVAQLCAALLSNARLHSKPDGVPKTIDELFTDEIKYLLIKPDEQNELVIGFSNDNPSENWEVF